MRRTSDFSSVLVDAMCLMRQYLILAEFDKLSKRLAILPLATWTARALL